MKLRFPLSGLAKALRYAPVYSAITVCAALQPGSLVKAAIVPNGISGVQGYAGQVADGLTPSEPMRVMAGDAVTVGDPLNSASWAADNDWQHGWQESNLAGASNQNWIGADLGAVHNDLSKIVIWNTREVIDRGSQSVNVYYATAPAASLAALDGTGTTFAAADGWTLLGNYVVPQSPNNGSGAGNGSGPDLFIDVTGINARDFGFQILSNYGSTFRQGFSSIQFTTAVPEPGTVVMLGAGLVGMGVVAVRRRAR